MYRLLERDVLKQLLIKEEQLRLSPEIQQLLGKIEDQRDIDWMDIIDDLQTHLIRDAIGENPSVDEIRQGLKYEKHQDTYY